MAEEQTQPTQEKTQETTETKKVDEKKVEAPKAEEKKEEVKEKPKEETKKADSKEVKKSTPAVKKDTTKKDDKEQKADLERIYVVPLRRGFLKVPQYKRSKKAVKTLKEFIAKHMKVPNRDLTKVKVDKYLNNEIWFRGIRKPLSKVKVKARKIADTVYVELAEMPDYVVYKRGRDEKKKLKVDKKKLDSVVAQEAAEEKVKQGRSDSSDPKEDKEKEKAAGEMSAEMNKEMAKADKHTSKAKSAKLDTMSQTSKRKAMKK